jgi:ketosteroid isomerase-like protein
VTGSEIVRRFVDALNRRDLAAMLELVHPDVQFQTRRGPKRGHEAVRKWLGEPYVELDAERIVDRLQVAGHVVVVAGRIRHCWRESGELADEAPTAWVFEVEDDLIVRWQVFDDEGTALAAAGLPTETTT